MALLPESKRDQGMIAACLVAVVLVYAFYNYYWSGKNTELGALQAHLDTLQVQNDSARRDIASGATAKLAAEAELYGRMLSAMRQLVPTANEVPSLLDQISTAARASGLEIGEVTPLDPIPGSIFDTYRYKMQVNGSYHRVGQLLGNIGSLTRVIAPMNLALARSTGTRNQARAGEAGISATFEIETYVAKTAVPRPTTAPSTATKTP